MGGFNEIVSAATNANGVATLLTTDPVPGDVLYVFCVDNVTHATQRYDPIGNAETCDFN